MTTPELPAGQPGTQGEGGWHYQLGAQQLGPVGAEKLAPMIHNGTVTSATLVWREGMEQWAPAGAVPELAGYFTQVKTVNYRAVNAKPGKLVAIAIITLISGLCNGGWAVYLGINILVFGIFTFGIGCLLGIAPLYLVTVAIFEFIYAAKLLATPVRLTRPSSAVPILQICCILFCNPLALAAGILSMVFGKDAEVQGYLAKPAEQR